MVKEEEKHHHSLKESPKTILLDDVPPKQSATKINQSYALMESEEVFDFLTGVGVI